MVYKSTIRTRKNNRNVLKKQIGGKQIGGEFINKNNAPPTLKDNLKKFSDIFVQLFNNMSIYTLDKVEDKLKDVSASFGIDPNKSLGDELKKMGEKAEQVNDVLDSPEGQKALSNLTGFFNRITKNVIIPNSRKLAEGIIESVEPVLERGQNAVFALLSASPFGAIIDIPRFLSESLGVVEKSVSLVDDVLDVGQDTVDKLKDEKNNFNGIVSEFGSLMEKTNTQLANRLDTVKNSVDDYGKHIMEKTNTQLANRLDTVKNSVDDYGKHIMAREIPSKDMAKTLQKYQNESKMIGGRVKDAYSDFIRGNVTSEQIIKQYGGTRKRSIIKRNRFQSRRNK